MDLTTNVLLPLLLAAIVANTAIIAVLYTTGRVGRDKPMTAPSVRGAGDGQALLSSSYVERSGAWSSEPGDTQVDQESDAMHDKSPDLTVLPMAAGTADPAPEAAMPPTDTSSPTSPAGIDALTGLLDPSAFARLIADESARIQRYGRSATVVVLEVDGLDRLSARLGPEAGDRVLPALADTIRRLARAADHAGRLGPSRFGVLLPETDEVAAINYVERVRRACELWLESGAIALQLAIGWAGTTGEPSLPETQRIATDRMYTELRRAQRRLQPLEAVGPGPATAAAVAPAVPAIPAGVPATTEPEPEPEPQAAAAAVGEGSAPAPAPTPVLLRTETEDDIPS